MSEVEAATQSLEPVPVELGELALARDLVQGLAGALKTCRAHGVRGGAAVGALQRLHGRLTHFFAEGSRALVLGLQPGALLYRGRAVLKLESGGEPALAALVRAGVRELTFLPALSFEELCAFVELLLASGEESEAYDLATVLWERELPHITHRTAESFAPDLTSRRFRAALEALGGIVGADAPVETRRAGRARAGLPPGYVPPGADDEEALAQPPQGTPFAAGASGEDERLGEQVVGLVLALYRDTEDAAERERLGWRLGHLLEVQLQAGHLATLVRALERLRDVYFAERGTPLGTAAEGVIDRLAEAVGRAPLVTLAGHSALAARNVAALLERLGTGMVPVAYALARDLPDAAARAPVLAALTTLARGDPSFLVRKLAGGAREGAAVCIPVLAALKDPRVEPALVEAYKRGRPEVRRLVLLAIGGRSEPFARGILLDALGSADPALRALAYRGLKHFPHRGTDRAAGVLFAAAERDLPRARSGPEAQDILDALLHFDEVRTLALVRPLVGCPGMLSESVQAKLAQALASLEAPGVVGLLRELARRTAYAAVARECTEAAERIQHGA